MNQPAINRHPTEIFGCPYIDNSQQAKDNIRKQFCPFLGRECNKPRKSEPLVKVGVCSVGYRGVASANYNPVIVCPSRFITENLFDTIREQYFKSWEPSKVKWVTEVSLGVGGSVDYVAAYVDNGKVQDFLCVELQAAGTTGTPWEAVVELKQQGKFLKQSYPYGINWANEFVKTMMQQVYKKGKILTYWKRKIVFIIQDVGLDYLKSATDASALRPANNDDAIHFCTFSMVWENDKWNLKFKEKVSTDLEGINKILGGSLSEHYPSVEEFMQSISRKV